MNQITDLEIADLTAVSSTFPERHEKEIPRDNMISTLLGQLKTSTGIIVGRISVFK